jgi:hypothetical protein
MAKLNIPRDFSAGPLKEAGLPWWTRYPPTIDGTYYEAIGEICARWTWIEFQLGVIIREALRLTKPQGRAVTAGMSVPVQAKILIAIGLAGIKGADARDPTLAREIGAFGEQLDNLRDMRNQYAHALFGYDPDTNSKLGIWKFKKPEWRIEPIWVHTTIQGIKNDAKILIGHQEKAQELTTRLKALKKK